MYMDIIDDSATDKLALMQLFYGPGQRFYLVIAAVIVSGNCQCN